MSRSVRPRPPHALVAAFVVLSLLGCDRRVEPYVAPESEPPPPERAVRVPGLENPAPRASMPLGPPDATGARTGTAGAESGAPIRGRVVAGAGIAAGGDGVLFVIARTSASGPPLAVKRLPVGPFPLDFEIGPSDVMIQGMPFAGPITLTARIDRDGNPMTREDDAPNATLAALQPGASDVELRLEAAGASAPAAGEAARPGGGSIRGRIVAGKGVEPGGEGVLYLIARTPGGGPPLAVKRLPIGPFPLDFEIGPGDVMIQGTPFAGPIALSARIDRDGNAMTRDPGEPAAVLAAPVQPGAGGVELRLEIAEP